MSRALVLLIALTACKSELPTRYEGLPEGSHPTCAWDIVNKAKGKCFANGERYRCYREHYANDDHYWTEVSCSPYNFIDKILR